MASRTPLDALYGTHMHEQLKAMLRHLQGLHQHDGNEWYKACQHPMPYKGIPMDAGKYDDFHV